MSGNDARVVELLEAQLGVLREILQAVTRPAPVSTLSRSDRASLGRLLPAIAGAVGSELFNSAEITEHDSAALRLVCQGVTVKQLGRLLRRGADVPVAGYLVQRQGVEAGACLWRVVQVPDFLRVQNPSVPHAGPDGSR